MLKKLRNDRGVSIVSLVVVIIVLLILFAITFTTAKDLIESTKAKKYATVMYLLKGEIDSRQDEALFISSDPINDPEARKVYIGTKIDFSVPKIEEKFGEILKAEVNNDEYRVFYNKADVTNPNIDSRYLIIKEYWYELKKDDLAKIGIDTDFADNDTKVFLVNYYTGEIIYTPGMVIEIEDPITGDIVEKTVYTLRTFENI